MSSTIFFFSFIPLLAIILLAVNLVFAPHNPYEEKKRAFDCGFISFLGQNRTQFSISFFIFALLFLLFDLEILLVYPYLVSAYTNEGYGLTVVLMFLLALTLGFAYELGKKALTIDSRQVISSIKNGPLYISVLAASITLNILSTNYKSSQQALADNKGYIQNRSCIVSLPSFGSINFLYKKSFSTTACLRLNDKNSNISNETGPAPSNPDNPQAESTNNQPDDGQPESSNNRPDDGQPESSNATTQQTGDQETNTNCAEAQQVDLQPIADEVTRLQVELNEVLRSQDQAMRNILDSIEAETPAHAVEASERSEDEMARLEEQREALVDRIEDLRDQIIAVDPGSLPLIPVYEEQGIEYAPDQPNPATATNPVGPNQPDSPESAPMDDSSDQPEASGDASTDQPEASQKRKRSSDDDDGSNDDQAEAPKRRKRSSDDDDNGDSSDDDDGGDSSEGGDGGSCCENNDSSNDKDNYSNDEGGSPGDGNFYGKPGPSGETDQAGPWGQATSAGESSNCRESLPSTEQAYFWIDQLTDIQIRLTTLIDYLRDLLGTQVLDNFDLFNF